MTCVVRISVGSCAVSKVKLLAVDGRSCYYDRGTGERRMDDPGELLCGLFVISMTKTSSSWWPARGFLAGRQVLPNRLEFSSLYHVYDDVCLRRFRFTRYHIHSLYDSYTAA